MKVAHLSISALPASVGGLEIVVDNLIRHQRILGHDVSLITRWKQAKAANAADLDYPVLALPPNPKISSRPFREVGPRLPVELAMAWHQLRGRFDIVHAHFLYPTAWLVQRTLKRFNVPMIATAHGADINVDRASRYGYRQHQIHESRLRRLVPTIGAVTAISPSTHQALQELGFREDRIHPIANAIELKRFKRRDQHASRVREEFQIPHDAQMLLSVGKNQPSKGYDIVPEVLNRLRADGRNVVWVIVGAGVERLGGQFAEAGVFEAVRLRDSRHYASSLQFPSDELIATYRAADAFVFPSLTEGAPLVALEAMAAGLPIVGNNVRGIADAIDHEECGLLVKPRDAGALTNGIARLLDDSSLRDRCIEGGRARASAHDWSKIAGQYLEVYHDLIERKSA